MRKLLVWFVLVSCITRYSTVLLEKLVVLQLVKQFPKFYKTRRSITVFKGTCHLSLPRASWNQSMSSNPTSLSPISILIPSLYAKVFLLVYFLQVSLILVCLVHSIKTQLIPNLYRPRTSSLFVAVFHFNSMNNMNNKVSKLKTMCV